MSRRHAILVRRAGEMWIVDDRGANGVFVNGQRILQAKLHDDDRGAHGPPLLHVRRALIAAAPAP